MIEITPLASTHPIIKPRKIVRDNERRKDERHPPEHKNDDSEPLSSNDSTHHIDEIV